MSKKLLFAFAFLSLGVLYAQQGINYKALIKDGSGNVVANQNITVQFQILKGVGMTNVYQETHLPTTDANGIIIINIGEGSIDSGDYSTIDWASDEHHLNVQIDTGAGLTDMGITQFMAVPYALSAANAATKIDELSDGKSPVGDSSLFLGVDAGLNDDGTSNANVGVGFNVLYSNTIGWANTATGAVALFKNTSGDYNTATGLSALEENTIGSYNTAYGGDALIINVIGNNNTAIGYQAGASSTGNGNIFLGRSSGYNETGSNTLYIENTSADANNALIYGEFGTDNTTTNNILRTNSEFQIGNPTSTGFAFPTIDGATNQILQTNGSGSLSWANENLPSGLEAIDEGNGIGWRLVGRDQANYGNISSNAVDLSYNSSASTTRGATGARSTAMGGYTTASGYSSTAMGGSTTASGDYSTAMGQYTTASGYSSTAMGNSTTASGDRSTAMGNSTTASGFTSTVMGAYTTASGDYSIAMGRNTTASSYASTAIGYYNIGGGGDATTWVEWDNLFEIGNGSSNANKSNAFTVLKNGTITAPSFDISEITDDKALITKEYADTNYNPKGLETLDEGNGIGWRLVGRDPANYGNIGLNATDLSYNNSVSTTMGATGIYATATGNFTTASGSYSTAMGHGTTASGVSSTAMGETTIASGNFSTAMGYITSASGDYSTAMGYFTTAPGNYSTVMGYRTTASSYASTAFGRYNIGGGNATSWVATDKLFEIGNGSSNANKSNAFTVFKDGKIGIGTVTPDARVRIDADTNEDAFKVRINGTTKFKVSANGGISNSNITTPAFALNLQNSSIDLLGRGRAFSWNTYSDRRIKSSIRNINYGLQTIMKLRPTAYDHHNTLIDEKSGASRLSSESVPDIGLIAQEVYELVPESVSKPANDEDLWSMDYTRLVPVLIKAMQEQQEIIEKQQKQIDELKALVQTQLNKN